MHLFIGLDIAFKIWDQLSDLFPFEFDEDMKDADCPVNANQVPKDQKAHGNLSSDPRVDVGQTYSVYVLPELKHLDQPREPKYLEACQVIKGKECQSIYKEIALKVVSRDLPSIELFVACSRIDERSKERKHHLERVKAS